jgi:hypothetical protein
MSRADLLRSLSAIALISAAAGAAQATSVPVINGGGATSPQGDYAGPNNPNTGAPTSELSTFNAATSTVQFGTYWGSGSAGQTAFLNNDLTCDINKVQNLNGGKCSGTPGGADTVHYAFSDSALTTAGTAQWATSSYGQSSAGNLIQLPALGTGEAIVVVDTNVTANGQVELSDNDLCEIFSGGYTDFSQITDSATLKPAAGAFKFVYRSDTAGATFILTEHLSKVCTAANTAAGVTFTATTSFATLFTNAGGISTAIPNSVGESGSAGVANYLSSLSGTTVTQAIGYVSPDWTSIPPAPDSFLSNGKTSALFVAGVFTGKIAYTPTAKNIESGLEHITAVATGSPTTPPSTAAQGANPLNWVPIVQAVSLGYPIVGYGTVDLPQCYATKAIGAGVIAFLKDHYSSGAYQKIQVNNGLAGIANTSTSKFLAPIKQHILANSKKQGGPWNTDIDDKTVCAKLAGR